MGRKNKLAKTFGIFFDLRGFYVARVSENCLACPKAVHSGLKTGTTGTLVVLGMKEACNSNKNTVSTKLALYFTYSLCF
jgi:hypothetical protein